MKKWFSSAAVLMALTVAAGPARADKVTDTIEKADKQQKQGKADDALKTLDKLVGEFRADPRAYDALARMHERTGIDDGKYKFAEDVLRQGVEATQAAGGQAHADALASVAAFQLRAGSGRAALERAKEAVASQATVVALARLAQAQVRVGELAGAIESANKAIQQAPNDALALEALGDAQLASGRAKDAEASYRKAAQADPTAANAQAGLALALLGQGRGAEAVAAARQATVMDESSGEAFATLGITLLKGEKNWTEAIAQAQQGRFLTPRSAPVLVAVAQIFEAAANHQQALLAYQEALKWDPFYGPAQLSQVPVLIARGEFEPAERALVDVLKSSPNNAEANRLLGEVRVRMGRHAAAIEPLRKAAESMAGRHDVQALLGGALYYAGQAEEAAAAYGRAVELAPDNMSYRKDYGFILGLAGKVDEGLKQLEQVISKPGYDDPTGFLAAGDLYMDAEPKRPDDAVTAYTKVLQLDAKNARAALGLGSAHYLRKDYDAAIASLQKAITIEPKAAGQASSRIGWCYLAKREVEQAKTWADKAKAAGLVDATLVGQISKYEKAVAAGVADSVESLKKFEEEQKKAAREAELINDYNRGDEATRARAVSGLTDLLGTGAYDVAVHALSTDNDSRVKGAACRGLARMGATGKKAKPHILAFVELQPPTIMEDKDLERWSLIFEAQSACRDALRQLQ